MNDLSVADRVRNIIVEQLGVGADQVQSGTLLVPDHDLASKIIPSGRDDLGADSLDVVELVMAAEEEFRIEISDDEAEPIQHGGTVGDFVRIVETKLAA